MAEVVQEAVAFWEERENARFLAEFRASLDEAEASIAHGEAIKLPGNRSARWRQT